MPPITVRFAPSPTGMLHIGSLRTALFNWLWAKKNNGVFILRIEDTDRQRYVEGAVENIQHALQWYGLLPDRGPFFQSDRTELYRSFADQLVAHGHAYYSFETPEELNRLREVQRLQGTPIKYDALSVSKLSDAEIQKKIAAGEPHVIRLRVPDKGVTTFQDQVYGSVSVENARIDDQVLLKSDGFPTYHLANVVDDHDMDVTHVIRGEEWLPSTPKHILLYQAFGWIPPVFCHLPLILGTDKSKLSKRHGAVPALEYQKLGYVPWAVLNFIALLGWNPKTEKEFFSPSELMGAFDLDKLNKSSGVFNQDKLDWLNAIMIRTMDIHELLEYARPFIGQYAAHANIEMVLAIVRTRATRLTDLVDDMPIFYEPVHYADANMLIAKGESAATARHSLEQAANMLRMIPADSWNAPGIMNFFKKTISELGLSNKTVLWPLRVALTGRTQSPGFDEVLSVLGFDESLKRIQNAMSVLKKI